METEKTDPLAACRFDFDEAAFREYYELHFRPHDKASGWKFMWLFFFLFLMYFGLLALGVWGFTREPEHFFEQGYLEPAIMLAGVAVLLAWCTSYGFRMWRGLRHPRWGRPRWEARTDAAFRMLADGPSKKPVALFSRSGISPMIVMPLAWTGCGWDDQPLFYDALPGLLPLESKIDPRQAEGRTRRRATFEARFYADRMEKGSSANPSTYPYADVHDIVEDARWPDMAVIRMKDELSEVVIRPGAFEEGSWEEVKDRIKEANGWITLREALFGGKRDERRKGSK